MRAIQELRERLVHEIWQRPTEDLPRWHALLISLARLAAGITRDLSTGALTLRAMSLVFTTLLAIVPLIAVSFSVLKGFGVHNQLQPALLNFLAPLGERADEITANIIDFVENIQVGVLGAVGMAFLLYTAISLVQKIEEAFNFTWNVGRSRSLIRKFSDYFSVILIGPLLVFLALGISTALLSTQVVQVILSIEPFGTLVRWTTRMVPYLLVIGAFTFLYMLIPNTRVRFGPALFGAVVAGVAWETVGRLFAIFVVTSTNYTAIYSGFAILLLFMIWLYLSWLILLTGSSIAFYRQYPEYLSIDGRKQFDLAPAQLEHLGLSLMVLIARAFAHGRPAPTDDGLARRLGVPVEVIARALDGLRTNGLIQATQGEPPAWLPARAPSRITVKEILDAVRFRGWQQGLLTESLPGGEDRVLAEIETALDQSMGGVSLQSLIGEEISD